MTEIAQIEETEANRQLTLWLRERGSRIIGGVSWSRITFTKRSYWAAIALVLPAGAFSGSFMGRYGFHVYDTGEVALVGRVEPGDPWNE